MKKIIKIKVIPKSSRNRIIKEKTFLKIYTTSAPEKGKANKKVICLLSEFLGISKRKLRIIKGEISQWKLVEVDSDI